MKLKILLKELRKELRDRVSKLDSAQHRAKAAKKADDCIAKMLFRGLSSNHVSCEEELTGVDAEYVRGEFLNARNVDEVTKANTRVLNHLVSNYAR